MKVALDAQRISSKYRGGVTSFALGLFEAFVKQKNHSFVCLANESNKEMFNFFKPDHAVSIIPEAPHQRMRHKYETLNWGMKRHLPLSLINYFFNHSIEQKLEPNADLVYIPYVPDIVFPFFDKPYLLSFHDLQHEYFPQFFTPQQIIERRITFKHWIKRAKHVQASSQQMKDDVLKYFSFLDPDHVFVIPEGVNIEKFSQRVSSPSREIEVSIPKDFLYYPAQLWPHKDHLTVLKAIKNLKNKGVQIPLILSGAKYSAYDGIMNYIRENSLGDQVFYLGLVSESDLLFLYQNARFVITATLYESSSLPIKEAAASGSAIIASDTPPNKEAGAVLCINLFEAKNSDSLEALLSKIWTDDSLIKAQSQKNLDAIKSFSWNAISYQYMDAFKHIVTK